MKTWLVHTKSEIVKTDADDEKALVKLIKRGQITPYTRIADAASPDLLMEAGQVKELEAAFARHSPSWLLAYEEGLTLEEVVHRARRTILFWKASTYALLVFIAAASTYLFMNLIMYALAASAVAAAAIGAIWFLVRRRN